MSHVTKKDKVPAGYHVYRSGNNWTWESLPAPECHSKTGFSTYAEAVEDCIRANPL